MGVYLELEPLENAILAREAAKVPEHLFQEFCERFFTKIMVQNMSVAEAAQTVLMELL